MTKAKYLKICQQMGTQPNQKKCPPQGQDFPYQVQVALQVFNKLGDRVHQGVGYLGKDFTTLPLHMKIHHIQDEQIFLQTLLRLDQRLIKKSAKQIADATKKYGKK